MEPFSGLKTDISGNFSVICKLRQKLSWVNLFFSHFSHPLKSRLKLTFWVDFEEVEKCPKNAPVSGA